MGDSSNNNGDSADKDDYVSQSRRPVPVPPPEAFHRADRDFPRDSSQQSSNSKFASGQRPSLVIRRQSSLFSQLPVRNKSRLFGDNTVATEMAMATTTSFSQSTWLPEDHQNTLLGGDDRQFPSREESSQFSTATRRQCQSQSQQQNKEQGNSSFFGAVMRKFSSSISDALPASPFGKGSQARDNNSLLTSPSGKTIMNIVNRFNSPFKFQSPQKTGSNGMQRHKRRRLWGSSSSFCDDKEEEDQMCTATVHKKNDEDDAAFSTPSSDSRKKKRRRRIVDDEHSSNILFPDHDDSRSSIFGGDGDHNWREAPIVDADNGGSTLTANTRVEILDWSIPTKVRIEVHGIVDLSSPSSLGLLQGRQRRQTKVDTWIRDVMRDNDEALMYWEYGCVFPSSDSAGSTSLGARSSERMRKNRSANNNNDSHNAQLVPRSIGTKTMNRQDSVTSRQSGSVITTLTTQNGNSIKKDNDTIGTTDLARYLVQTVRGPHAKYSRKRVLEEDCWWKEKILTPERAKRQWQQAMRSIFSNYRHRVHLAAERYSTNTSSQYRQGQYDSSVNATILDTYFYCIGQDHSVLFRVGSNEGDGDDANDDNTSFPVFPIVLVSSTSVEFRAQLEQHGVDMRDECFELIESIEEREARETAKIAAAAEALNQNKMMSNALLSPGVEADLEALRRAQAFGEAAGADVFVKVKKAHIGMQQEQQDQHKQKLPKALRISKWDNVSLFFEVYLNQYGDVMATNDTNSSDVGNESGPPRSSYSFNDSRSNRRLPLLICQKGLGPFEHASMKRLRLFPAQTETDNNENVVPSPEINFQETNGSNAIDICGILLPSALRKLLLGARNRILEDEANHQLQHEEQNSISKQDGKEEHVTPQDSSKHAVLHIMRSTKHVPHSLMGGLNGTLVFNQGKTKTLGNTDFNEGNIFECPNEKVVSSLYFLSDFRSKALARLE